MNYRVKCTICDCAVWIRGSDDPETNAIELNENDSNWSEACAHIHAGDYEIVDAEAIEWD